MIDPFLSEWISFGLRWLHVITAIAWIGSSFYFIHLDLSLRKAPTLPPGAGGEAWQVHGGGFYNMRKYLVAPPEMPAELTWFKWESYATWLSGFFLLVWVYYLGHELYLVDPQVRPLTGWQAAAFGIGGLAFFWLVYEGLCRSPLGRSDTALLGVGLVVIMGAAWAFGQVFGGRGAMLHTGAMIATWMSGSVFVVIIPNQKKVVATLLAGGTPDPRLGAQAKQRSLHNNYLTLPVVFLMLSNHYPLAYQSRWNWLIAGLVVVAGALIRHFFNQRHAHRPTPWWTWAAAALALAIAAALSLDGAPSRAMAAPRAAELTTLAGHREEALGLLRARCAMCHARQPGWEGIGTAPKGVVLETAGDIERQAPAIRNHAVLTHAMPPGNITEMSLEERRRIALWLAARDIRPEH